MRRDPSFNPWTAPLGTRRGQPAPVSLARRAMLAELHGAPSTAEAFGVTPEAWTLAVAATLEASTAQAIVDRLGYQRGLAVATYARAANLDPVELAQAASRK